LFSTQGPTLYINGSATFLSLYAQLYAGLLYDVAQGTPLGQAVRNVGAVAGLDVDKVLRQKYDDVSVRSGWQQL
jgi:hypothetical protein